MKKKKIIGLVITFIMLFETLCGVPLTAYADSYATSGGFGGNRFRWTLDANKVFTLRGEGYITALDFENDEDYDVYRAMGDAEKIIVSEGIKNIPQGFLAETYAKSIVLPDSLEEIGEYGICAPYIKSLHIPKNVHKLGLGAINCDGLRHISVAADSPYFTSVNGVLYNKAKDILVKYPAAMPLTTYTILDGVYKIASCAFYDSNLHRIVMPDTVEELGTYTFTASQHLTYIRLSENLGEIPPCAFEGCYNLCSIKIPDNVDIIMPQAFYGCRKLEYVDMSDNIINIRESAFAYCEKLRNIYLPDSLSTIGANAFYNCGIEKISIPSGVTALNIRAFAECADLKNVTLSSGLSVIEANAFQFCTSLTTINIPDTVTTIGQFAFYECKNLVSVHLPTGLKKIERNTFTGCEKLSNVNLPYTIEEIGTSSFTACTSIRTITLPGNIKIIGQSAFAGCKSLESISIPKSITTIGQTAFSATGLINVHYAGTTDEWSSISIAGGNNSLLNAYNKYNGYTVKFYKNDGTTEIYHTQEVVYGDYITPPENPTRTGYVFLGWYANQKCTGDVFVDTVGKSTRKVTQNISLYAKWAKADTIAWGRDTFSFGNTSMFWGSGYTISDEHFNLLTENLGYFDKLSLKRQRKSSFEGSCYGMSVVMAMLNKGFMTSHFIENGKKTAYELSSPKDNQRVASIVNYYQLSQNLPDIYKKIRAHQGANSYLAKELDIAFLEHSEPIVIAYEYKDGKDWYGHAVLAYKTEVDDFYNKISIVDPNFLAYTDRFNSTADNIIIVRDTEPRYMYVSSNWDDVIYEGAEGEHSVKDGNLRLVAVLRDTSAYTDINIQEKLTNQCMGNNLFSLLSIDEGDDVSEAYVEIGVNFDEFEIAANDTIIENIPEGSSWDGDNITTYNFDDSDIYEITPISEKSDNYVASATFENATQRVFLEGQSGNSASFVFEKTGKISILSNDIEAKKIILSVENQTNIGEICIETQSNKLTLSLKENESYELESDSELSEGSITITDIDGFETTIPINQASKKISISYLASEKKYVLNYDENSSDELVEKLNTVIFYSNGGTIVESITNVNDGDTITEPMQPTNIGYVFEGWYKDEFFTEKWDFETDVVTGNINLYAKWEEDTSYYHIVSFDDGTSTSQIIVTHGYELVDADYPELPIEEGYVYSWDMSTKIITDDTQIQMIKTPIDDNFTISFSNTEYDKNIATVEIAYNTSLTQNINSTLTVFDENNSEISSVDKELVFDENKNFYTVTLPKTETNYNYTLVCTDENGNTLEKTNGILYAEKEICNDGIYIYSILDDDTIEILSYIGEEATVEIPTAIDEITITKIASEAFASNVICEIVIPQDIVIIENNAFGNCTNLAKITVNEDNTSFGSYNGDLYSKDLKVLYQYSPAKCNSDGIIYTSFVMPNFVTEIADKAFYGASLKDITLSDNIVNIEYEGFDGCSNLSNLYTSNDNEKYTSVDGVLYSKDISALILYPSAKNTEYYCLPEGVSKINSGAFVNGELLYLALPKSLEIICENSFIDFYVMNYLYCGNESEWSNVVKTGNEDIENSDINYNYNSAIRIDAAIDYVIDENSVLNAILTYNYSYQPHTAFVAVYDGNNRLLSVESVEISEYDEPDEFIFKLAVSENSTPNKIKVLFFDSSSTIKPLRSPLEIPISE